MKTVTFGTPDADLVLIQPVDERELAGMEREVNAIREGADADFCLTAFVVEDWNKELFPWAAPAVFGREDFGDGALLVRQLPADFAPEDAPSLLSELAEALRLGKKPGSLGMRDETLATMACKAAVKAGKASDAREWVPVAEAVLRGEVKYCPHGRPVTMRMTKRQLDRNFKRT